jgi:transposase
MKKITNSVKTKTAEQPQTISATTRHASLTIGIDLGDQWSQFCLLDVDGMICEEGRVRSTRSAFQARFGALASARIALETGTHSLWASELLIELGHEVIVAHVREVRAITGSHSKSDQVDARKLARYVRVDPEILHPVQLRDSDQQRDLVLIRARAALVRARSLLVNTVRGLVKPFGSRVSPCDADGFAHRCREELPADLGTSLRPMVEQIAQLTEQIQDYEKQINVVAAEKYPDTAPAAERVRSRSGHGAHLCADPRQPAALCPQPRCGLLPGIAAPAQPVR